MFLKTLPPAGVAVPMSAGPQRPAGRRVWPFTHTVGLQVPFCALFSMYPRCLLFWAFFLLCCCFGVNQVFIAVVLKARHRVHVV